MVPMYINYSIQILNKVGNKYIVRKVYPKIIRKYIGLCYQLWSPL